ncbi:MAG: signal peptidase II [Labilithrix sp.]|nr:signal peptidase II [Labilithrix sp.]
MGERNFPLRAAVLLLAVGLFGCDHATKIAAHASLSQGRTVPLIDGIVELRYAANDDTAFSLLRTLGVARGAASTGALVALASLAFAGVVVAWIATRKRASIAHHAGFGLVVAGALGNLVDRIARGYVVDFIHVSRWPVFNVADVAVVAGVVLVGLASMGTRPPREAPS